MANPTSAPKIYREDFVKDRGGFWGWSGNKEGLKSFEQGESTITSRSPWWVDYNHAPPGAGYLHMVFCLNTKGPLGEAMKDCAGTNGFVDGGFPTDFRGAELTFRLKGELRERGAHLVLLLQASSGRICSGWALKGQPLSVTPEWSDQKVKVVSDPAQWVCLGSRQSRLDYYGRAPLQQVISDVNVNLMLVMFPLNVVPMGPIAGDPHILRAGQEYPLWRSELPEGYVTLDRVEIAFPAAP